MCKPAWQEYHSANRFDDPLIANSDRLLRHLRLPVQIVDTPQGKRVSDRAFAAPSKDPGTSVDLECLLHNDGISEIDRRGIMPNSYGLVAVDAGAAREHTGGVAWTPKPEEPELEGFAASANQYHGEIIRPFTNSKIRDLAFKAQLLWIEPDVAFGPYEGQTPSISGASFSS